MKKTLIHIITKNDSNKLSRILKSIFNNNTLKENSILIIDDSSKQNYILENKDIVKNSSLNINYIDSQTWENYKREILKKIDSNFISNLKIGKKNWNTPSVRNVGLVCIMLFYSDYFNIIFFDDDMDVSNINYSVNNITSSIEGINITGSPDLSRFEWIQLYMRVLINDKRYVNFSDIEYPDELVLKFSINNLSSFIEEYTTLSLKSSNGCISDYKEIPSREEFSGGAYINSLLNINIGVFPDIYNEDWCYMNLIQNTKKIKNNFYIGGSVRHKSSKKDILDTKRLFEEEEGEFFQLYFRLDDKKNYFSIIDKKLRIIEHEIYLCNLLLNKYNLLELKLINENLKKYKAFYNNLFISIEKYKKMYEKYLNDNNHWRNICNKLVGIL